MTRRALFAAVVVLSLTIAAGLTLAIADCVSTTRRYHDQPQPPGDTITVKLTVSPAAAPTPALKYELLPRLVDRTPGNAATRYGRAFLLHVPDGAKLDTDKFRDWLNTPADKFPVKEVKAYLTHHADRFRELENAARADRCDWGLIDRNRAEGYGTRLPEAEGARNFAPLLALRTRVELAECRLDDAARTLRTGFQLAKHIGEAPAMINHLVGVSVAGQMADRVEELVQMPGAPNLYWALSGLPRPLIDFRPAIDGEEIILRGAYPMIDEFENGPVAEDRADVAVRQFFRTSELLADGRPDERDPKLLQATVAAVVAARHAAATKELTARGRTVEEVERMTPAQAVFLHAWVRYGDLRDDLTKWFRSPPPVALAGMADAEVRIEKVKRKVSAEADLFMVPFLLTTPAYRSAFQSHVRLERRLAALRAVEALRLHAAANGGTWPAKLEQVKVVAVPADPATGKPFAFEVKGDTAVLSGPPPEGQPATRTNALRYELIVRPVK